MDLQAFREKQNLTQEELAEKSGVSIRTIQRVESGSIPKGYTLKALCRALGIEESNFTVSIRKELSIVKIINISSLVVAFLPFISIVPPLLIMLIRKEFGQLPKRIVSLQIIWTVLALMIFFVSATIQKMNELSGQFTFIVMLILVTSNVFIILRNAVEIDRKQALYFNLPFSFF